MWWVCWCTQEAEAGEGDEMFTEQYADAETGTLIRPRIRTHTHACRCFAHVVALPIRKHVHACHRSNRPVYSSSIIPASCASFSFHQPSACDATSHEPSSSSSVSSAFIVSLMFVFLIFCSFNLCVRAVAWQGTGWEMGQAWKKTVQVERKERPLWLKRC